MVGNFAQRVRLIERSKNLFSDRFNRCCGLGLDRTQPGKHDHEFITSQARHGVAFAHAQHQTPGYLFQQLVAHVMPERVVERLEIIQIDEQQCTMTARSRTDRNGLFQPILQERSVGQAGELIKVGQILNPFFGFSSPGDVFGR